MKTLIFPDRTGAVADVAGRLASLERLLSECRERHSNLREDGRRLCVSLDRLSSLSRDLLRSTARLRRSADRLRTCHRRIRPPAPNP
jgi:hypothetical protein